MTDHDQAAIDAAAEVADSRSWRAVPRDLVRDMLAAARPHLEAAERERLRELAEAASVSITQPGTPATIRVVPLAALLTALTTTSETR